MLAVLLVLAQMPAMPGQPMGPIVSSPATSRSSAPSSAFFEFAPASGAGVGTECACAAVTGAKGEAMTFTRASSGTCTKGANGLRTTVIADGDLVTCSTDQPRVMRDADGALAYLAESTRTNVALRSQEWDNAAWVKYRDGAAALPVVSAVNSATAPDGTVTADTADIGATTGSQSSIIYQGVCTAGVQCAVSGYVRGPSGSGTTDICAGTSGAACAPCPWVSTSWTWCQRVGIVGGATSAYVGNATFYNGGTARAAQSVYLWQGQVENSQSFPTSAIPTTGSSAARAVDVASFSVAMSGTTASWAASVQPEGLTSGATFFQHYVDANNSVRAEVNGSNQLLCTFRIGGVDSTVNTTATLTAGAVNRVACTYGASGRSACIGGTCVTTAGALALPAGAATFYVGTRQATGNEANSLVSRVCYQPNSDTRCL